MHQIASSLAPTAYMPMMNGQSMIPMKRGRGRPPKIAMGLNPNQQIARIQ